uniref:Uncharacterized protein n=1 Tax=Pseudomonas aeruginosa TaxID=287 RepID=A0A7S5YCI1_PSEAI|nr:hypothetical protein [Pseudomonas aeruginosa]
MVVALGEVVIGLHVLDDPPHNMQEFFFRHVGALVLFVRKDVAVGAAKLATSSHVYLK